MNFLNKCLVYSILFFLPAFSLAQIEGPLIRYFGRELYKAGTQNWSIAKDANGLVYFGNNKGLLEYDGHLWRLYPLPNRTIVRSIDIDSLGNIYVGGQNEIGVFWNSDSRLMEYESLTHLIPENRRDFEDVWKIFKVNGKRVYCSEKEIFVIDGETVKTILPTSGRFENYFHVNDKIYIQDSEDGLYLLDDDDLRLFLNSNEYKNDRIISITGFGDQTLIVTQENGIYSLNDDELVSTDSKASQFLKENKAYASQVLRNGNLLVGTVIKGLITFTPDGRIVKSLNKSNGLANNTILCALEDSYGNIWLGLDNGINHIETNSPFNFINSINGLEGTGYTAFAKDGEVFLGTNQGLFSKKENDKNFRLASNKASQIWGHSLFDGSYYIHAHEGTFLMENGSLEAISGVQGAWKIIELESKPGIYLQGTYEGFFAYKKEQGQKLKLMGKLDGFSESSRIFEEDDSGNIWVSHAYRGLYRIKLSEDGTSIIDVRRFNSKDGLPDDLYLTVSKIRGEIVFTTSEGIYEFNKENETFKPHSGLSELIGKDANVLRIIEDETGNVWFCTDSEFGRISILPSGVYNDVEVNYLNEIQEPLVDGFEDVFIINESIAYIPVETGFIKYDTDKLLKKDFRQELMIRGVYGGSNLDSLIATGKTQSKLELSSDQNNIKINFVVPSFQNMNSVHYQYRLVGKDEKWSEWTSSTEKEYSNLESGNYTFQVKGRNSFKTETPVAEFGFSILPPWYASRAAKAGYIILIVLGLFIFYRIVKRRELNKRLVLQEESQATILRKEAELKRISEQSESEIVKLRNEKLRADIRHKNSELASTTMHLVQKSEILQKIKADLGELTKLKEKDQLQSKIKQIERAIDADVRLDKNWERFESHFDQVHENFFKNLRAKFPNLTPKDQKLCAYLRMNLSTKEIAPLLNISVRGVEISRYRLRKKLNLDSEDNLVSFIMDI
jgi:ligand-binding sensor domain-containing protein/DNA-binding CsgD family transcriptional regulator